MGNLRILLTLFVGIFLLSGSVLWAQYNIEENKNKSSSGISTYVVQEGDDMQTIAIKHYEDGSLAGLLWQANKPLLNNSKVLTPGETLYIFPEATLRNLKNSSVPPAPVQQKEEIYKKVNEYTMQYPEYFNFLADKRGLGGSGSVRIKTSVKDPKTNQLITKYVEVREVGEIIASFDRGAVYWESLKEVSATGKTLMTANDMVIVRVYEDVAKLLDSDSYDEADPYFREYAIYSYGNQVREPDKNRADKGKTLGTILNFRGKLTITSRVEGLAPVSEKKSAKAKKAKDAKGQDLEPVSYMAMITNSTDVVHVGDKLFLFVDLDQGHERLIEAPYVEKPDTYVSPGY